MTDLTDAQRAINASDALEALVEERDRLAAELDHQLAERAALTARAEAAEAALEAHMRIDETPTHRHRKRGTLYRVVALNAEVQSSRPILEGDVVTVYIGQHGDAWARPKDEFDDGRFESVAPTPDLPEFPAALQGRDGDG